MADNDIHSRVISIHGKNGIRVETEVHEYNKHYNTLLIINGEVVYKNSTIKPEPKLTFGDLKQGAEFTLTDRGDKSVFMKIEEVGRVSNAIWIENKDTDTTIRYGAKGATCFIPEDALVEKIIDL